MPILSTAGRVSEHPTGRSAQRVRRRCYTRRPRTARARRRSHEGGRARVRALLSVADRAGIADLARDLLDQGIEVVRHGRHARGARGGRSRARPVSGPDRRAPPWSVARSAPSTRPSTPASWRAATSPPTWLTWPNTAWAHRHRRRQRRALRAPGRTGLVPIDEARRDDRRRRAGAAPRRGPQLRRRGRRLRPGRLRACWSPSCASTATSRPRSASASPPRPSPAWPPTTRRWPPTSTTSVACAFPKQLSLVLRKQRDLSYGENPQQRGALYREASPRPGSIAEAQRIQGPEPTFNDLIDLDAAWRIACDFRVPPAPSSKQRNPVGLASHDSLRGAIAALWIPTR